MGGAGGLQLFAGGTGIEIALVVIGEIGAGELAVRRHFTLIPDGDVRIDAAPNSQPSIAPVP